MTAPATPRTVEQYLDLLRAELQGADPALIQDALYDAEEHLRAELAQSPGETEDAHAGRDSRYTRVNPVVHEGAELRG